MFSKLQDTEWLWNLVWLGLGNSVNEVLGPFSKLNDPKWNLIHSVCEQQPLKLKVIWHFAFGVLHSAFSILQNTSYRIEVISKYLLEPNGPLSLPNVLARSFQSFLPINCYRTVWGCQTTEDVIRLHMHSQPLPVPPSTPLDLHWPGTVLLRMRVQSLPPISNFID